HRRQRDELEEVVLEDVADRAGFFVVAGAPFDSERFGDRDLDVVDELPVPDRLEDPVREAKSQHVLNGLLAEVVVDAEDLLLGEVTADPLREAAGRLEVVAEGLLDDEPRPALRAPSLAESRDDGLHRLRRHSEVVDAVAARSALLVELVQQGPEAILAALVREIGGEVMRPFGQPVPDLLLEVVPAELADGVLHPLAELVVGPIRARDADDGEALRQEVPAGERVQRREDLAAREIAGGAEDDEDARLGCPPWPEPDEQRILGQLSHVRIWSLLLLHRMAAELGS